MESSSPSLEGNATRWRVACDGCAAEAWIGGDGKGASEAFCEACQQGARPDGGERSARAARCAHCGSALTFGEPRFVELSGELQHLTAVLEAWDGDGGALGRILPERPRYLSALDPPQAAPGDPDSLVQALASLERGSFSAAALGLERVDRSALDRGSAARADRALGVARWRIGDRAAAERAFARSLEFAEDESVRLDRGVLRALRSDWAGAREDLALAGTSREARWNRATLAILEAVASSRALPGPRAIQEARAEAGEPSDYWSDHTVGRLLWSALVERARAAAGGARPEDDGLLRAAEAQFEFDTFWDRAMMLHAYATLGRRADAARIAAPLAAEALERLLAEPYARAAGPVGEALSGAALALRSGERGAALAALQALAARPDVARYRAPCVHCGSGSWGVEAVEET